MTRPVRNLSLFVLATLALPWLGVWLEAHEPTPRPEGEPGIGMLLFITAPLVVSLLLRAFAGDGFGDLGLRPAIRGQARWYMLAVLFHPSSTLLVLGLGVLMGRVHVPALADPAWKAAGQAITLAIAPSLFKNVFEEFAWRGYLAPRLETIGVRPLASHLGVGVVWAAWHVPYYLVLLPRATFNGYASGQPVTFLAVAGLALLATSILYGELRLRTASVWPALLAHTASNAFTDSLIIAQLWRMEEGSEFLLSPGMASAASIACSLCVGLLLVRARESGAPRRGGVSVRSAPG